MPKEPTFLYVIICLFPDDDVWGLCDFTKWPVAHARFLQAHGIKRQMQAYLKQHGNPLWTKNRFRVVRVSVPFPPNRARR